MPSSEYLLTILGCTVATWLSRILPFLLLKNQSATEIIRISKFCSNCDYVRLMVLVAYLNKEVGIYQASIFLIYSLHFLPF